MHKRTDYINGLISHRDYYGQFVDEKVKQGVLRDIGIEKILQAKDENFNNIPLRIWDGLFCVRSTDINEKLYECGDFPSMAGLCCIAKEGARQLKEEYKK